MTIGNDRITTTGDDMSRAETTQTASAGEMASAAKSQASELAGTTREASRDVMEEVSDQVAATASTAKAELDSLVGRVKHELSEQGYAKEQQLASGMRTMSRQLSALANGRPEEAGNLANVLRDAQSKLQSYAASLEQRGPRAMLDDVSAFARRRPGTFLVLAGVGGFVVGRLVRSGAASNGDTDSLSSYSPGDDAWSTTPDAMPAPDVWDVPADGADVPVPAASGTRSGMAST